jgi:hypothetical protein
MQLRGTDSKVGEALELKDSYDDPDELHEAIEKLKDFADHDDDWYVDEGFPEDEVEDLRESAMGLASGIMQTLGYEWI